MTDAGMATAAVPAGRPHKAGAMPAENGAAKTADAGSGFFAEPIQFKCLALIVVMTLLILAGGIMGIFGLYSVNAKIAAIAEISVAKIRIASQIQTDALEMSRAETNVIIADNPETIDGMYAILSARAAHLRGQVDAYREISGHASAGELADLETSLEEWLTVYSRVRALSHLGDNEAAFALATDEGRKLANSIVSIANNLGKASVADVEADHSAAQDFYHGTLIALFAGVIIGLLFAGGYGTLTIANIRRDIARRNLAELSLRDANGRLSEQADELEKSNAELEQIAYVASHDLKAPLRAIDNLATWIAEDLGDTLEGESKENLELLRGRVARLEELLADLLRYSRAGRVDGDIVEIDTGNLIAAAVEMIAPPSGFSVHWPEDAPKLTTAHSLLSQILSNLIGNAIKHHDRETGRIDITISDIGPAYEFAVSDDGPGIPVQFHDRVFQMFQSLKPRDEVEGSGMGLAIVKKLIESQGYEIRIESKDGERGTTFRFAWPKVWRSEEKK